MLTIYDDAILRKPDKLTDEEYASMKTHSARGAEMVDKILTGVEDEDVLEMAHNIIMSSFGLPSIRRLRSTT